MILEYKSSLESSEYMDFEKYLMERHFEFWSDIYHVEKEEVRALKKYIDYVEKELKLFKKTDGTEEWVLNLFERKQMDYLHEAFSNLLLGNYNALGSMTRVLIENYINYAIIKKYHDIEIWKDWYLWSTLKSISRYKHKKNFSDALKLYHELCEIYGVQKDFVADTSGYAWLKRITKKEKNSFATVCNLVDRGAYSDFEELSGFSHNNDLITKFTPILMERLAGFIYHILIYTDKFLTVYDKKITNKKEYNKLYLTLLNHIDKCVNFKEFDPMEV